MTDAIRCEKVNALGVRCSRAEDHAGVSGCLFEMPSDEVIEAILEHERVLGAAKARPAEQLAGELRERARCLEICTAIKPCGSGVEMRTAIRAEIEAGEPSWMARESERKGQYEGVNLWPEAREP